MNLIALLPVLLLVVIAAAILFMRRVRQHMPVGLRMIMWGCFIGILFIPLALVPGGGHSINGELVSFTEFWRRGGGPVFVAVGVLLPVIGYGIATRKGWSRYLFIGFLVVTSLLSFAFHPNAEDVISFLFIGLMTWYLFWRRSVSDYFAADAH